MGVRQPIGLGCLARGVRLAVSAQYTYSALFGVLVVADRMDAVDRIIAPELVW